MIRQVSKRALSSNLDHYVSFFESLLGPKGVATSDLEGYNVDWTNQYHGNSSLVLKPSSTEQVSEIMKYCHSNRLPVVPQGGNTGLVGGSVAFRNEIVVSMSRMNQILDFDPLIGSITLQAGVVLQQAQQHCDEQGCVMPLDLASKGTCQIGGNLATNAGGISLIQYGSLRGNTLGLQAVMADGNVLDTNRNLRKDNVGYDLKQLLIGSEGTLGIITGAQILTPVAPTETHVCLMGMTCFEDCLTCLKLARATLGSDLISIEYFDSNCMDLVKAMQSLPSPFEGSSAYHVLVEGSNLDRMLDLYSKLASSIQHMQAVLSENERQKHAIWRYREDLSASLKATGKQVLKYDVSLPIKELDNCTQVVEQAMNERYGRGCIQVHQYGHLGDGNLHFNALSNLNLADQAVEYLEKVLYDFISRHRGSISAEHGIGTLKSKSIVHSRSKHEINCMKRIKQLLDPQGLLNPGKVLPD